MLFSVPFKTFHRCVFFQINELLLNHRQHIMSVTWTSNPPDPATRRAIITLQVFYSTFFVAGILENILVFREINKKKQRKLTTNQLLMLHLTVVDILILMMLTPTVFYTEADVENSSTIACRVLFPMVIFSPFLRVFTQVIIAMDRRRAVVTPLKPRLKRSTIISMLVLCWLLSTAFTAPVIWEAKFGPWSCGNVQPGHLRKVMFSLKTVMQFVLPLIIISVCYIQAGLALRRSRFRVQASQMGRNTYQHLQQEATRLKNIRVCKAFAIMIVVFAVCTAPINAICLWMEYGGGRYEAFENQAVYCFVANFPIFFMSFLDPIIYGTYCLRNSLLSKVWTNLVKCKNKASAFLIKTSGS